MDYQSKFNSDFPQPLFTLLKSSIQGGTSKSMGNITISISGVGIIIMAYAHIYFEVDFGM
jgi:hypothetical protein